MYLTVNGLRLSFTTLFFFFQAEDGIRDLVRSRGLGDVYKRQAQLRDEVAGRFDLPHRDAVDPDDLAAVGAPRHEALSLIHI